MQKVSRVDKELFLTYYNELKSDSVIAKEMNIPSSTITYFRKKIMQLPPVGEIFQEEFRISKEQEEILIGTVLGDSCILYTHSQCRYPKITFSHSIKQREYFITKYNKLSSLMTSYLERQYHKTITIKEKSCNVTPVLYAIGKNIKLLKKYRDIFYIEGKKIIPIEFLQDNFTERSLAYLFMDDGCKNLDSINLNLHCFEIEELTFFKEFLYNKFNLKFIVKKDKAMYLRYESREIFYNLVLPYMVEDSLYKLEGIKSSLNLVNLGKS